MNINHSVFYSYVDVHSFSRNTVPFTEHIIKAGCLSLIEMRWCLIMISFAICLMNNNGQFSSICCHFCVSFWSINFFKVVDFSWKKIPSTDTYDSSKHWAPNATKENRHQGQGGNQWKLPWLGLVIMISLTITNTELWVWIRKRL